MDIETSRKIKKIVIENLDFIEELNKSINFKQSKELNQLIEFIAVQNSQLIEIAYNIKEK